MKRRKRDRSIVQLEGIGLVSKHNLPLIKETIYRFFQSEISTEEGLKAMIEKTQPALKTEEEKERFYGWISKKTEEDKVRVLLLSWYYP